MNSDIYYKWNSYETMSYSNSIPNHHPCYCPCLNFGDHVGAMSGTKLTESLPKALNRVKMYTTQTIGILTNY